jgi:hypothetical protein
LNVVMNVRFQYNSTRGIYWVVEDMLASQEGLCSMELWGRVNRKPVPDVSRQCYGLDASDEGHPVMRSHIPEELKSCIEFLNVETVIICVQQHKYKYMPTENPQFYM